MRRIAGLGLVVLAMLAGCSSSHTTTSPNGLTTGPLTVPPLPAGWKVVENQVVAVDVPSSWPVEHWQPTCGVTEPVLYLGPQGQLPTCTTFAPAAEVDLGAYAYGGAIKPVIIHLNGMEATEVTQHINLPGLPGKTGTIIWVRVITPNPFGLRVFAGDTTDLPGGAPGMAKEIEKTIHSTQASS
jgi:hypothetical protein